MGVAHLHAALQEAKSNCLWIDPQSICDTSYRCALMKVELFGEIYIRLTEPTPSGCDAVALEDVANCLSPYAEAVAELTTGH
ncbi:hypothetical protein [Streptomyces sp. NBC_01236]|uniref:hypothetical protein n=1 Tax=Streptomyces sp. NBC_01236 TaxID=2903789 RepID=UPI002E0F3114|nr:hypothetical protein OG324_08875 [Streptomyces sp. NBC_01236]